MGLQMMMVLVFVSVVVFLFSGTFSSSPTDSQPRAARLVITQRTQEGEGAYKTECRPCFSSGKNSESHTREGVLAARPCGSTSYAQKMTMQIRTHIKGVARQRQSQA